MRDPDNIRAISLLPVNQIGLIFYKDSPRYAGDQDPREILRACDQLPRTGVFVNAPLPEVLQTIREYELATVQLHGAESPEYILELRKCSPQTAIIKAFSVGDQLPETSAFEDCCEYFLFDTEGTSRGGNGRSFNWSLLSEYGGNTPFFLSGGIGPDSLSDLLAFRHPKWIGIDLNSCFERAPGEKSIALLEPFLMKLHRLPHLQPTVTAR